MRVYKGSAKGISKGKISPSERIIFLDNGTAIFYEGNTLIQSDVLYKHPDSHVIETDEDLPKFLYATKYELARINKYNIKLPIEVM